MPIRPVHGLPLALALLACADPAASPRPRAGPAGHAEPAAISAPEPLPLPDRGGPPEPATPAEPLPGFTRELRLEHASHPTPGGAPTVVAHGPPGLLAGRPLHLVLFLHGWRGCARALAADGRVACREGTGTRLGWGLSARHDEAATATLLVVPQLSWLERDGSPGRFSEPGFFDEWLDELLERLRPDLGGGRPDIESLTLVAHSAGYESALALLRLGHAPIRNVVLMDALYGGTEDFASWASAEEGRRLLSLHTDQRSTSRESAALSLLCSERMGAEAVSTEGAGPLGEDLRAHRVVVRRTPWGHGDIPRRQLAEVLRALPLPARSGAEVEAQFGGGGG